MQSSHLRTNQHVVVGLTGHRTKSVDATLSPCNDLDEGRYFSSTQGVDNEGVTPNDCHDFPWFQFCGFFRKNDEIDATFCSLALKDINPVSDDEEYLCHGSNQTTTDEKYFIEVIVDEKQKILNIDINDNYHHTENLTGNIMTEPQSNKLRGLHQEVRDDLNIRLDYPFPLKQNDSGHDSNDDNNEQSGHLCNEKDGYHVEDSCSDGSSVLSFDDNDFYEQDFEADYGLAEKYAGIKKDPNPIRGHLPTIQEHAENGMCYI